MTIGGRAVGGAARTPVEDPAVAQVFAYAPACSAGQLDEAVDAAAGAAAAWAALPLPRRRELLRQCGKALAVRAEEVAELVTREQGKPLRAALAEVRLSADWFTRTADLVIAPEEPVADRAARVTVERVPHGVVAAIAPSNFPIILAVCKVAPALLAGNTVVLTPSPATPLSTLLMGEILRDGLPPGVLNVISGGTAISRALTEHPAVRLISFTGSVETGRAIARQAAPRFVRTVLELGGNDPAIVLPDVDLDRVASELFDRSMRNSGQFCAAVKRVYVPERLRADLVERLRALAGAARVGDGLDPATDLGPLVSRRQLERVAGLVADAVAAGGRAVAGGAPLDRPGHFFPPTVVTDLPAGTALELEEQFGPVIPVIGYSTINEAVARANATRFGLGGSVWGPQEPAREVAARLDCGTTWINTHGELRHDVPFGGTRDSGLGVEYGYWGLLEYTRIRVRHTATAG
ncbi:aldehyde dehydrogenase [Marinitenerispora sediminis]|uniref:Aldehyde dehydrogenase n=1 Tax=Marinitenerispora sediminis TaxID=1931232 RepID=A0A368T1R2_9ACTN|nr:aldehyde dehydrogenase [Marinitenerispora sediminis]RCV51309.1 aldehyde dehydrogenase [Marinitenerispora sediminis]